MSVNGYCKQLFQGKTSKRNHRKGRRESDCPRTGSRTASEEGMKTMVTYTRRTGVIKYVEMGSSLQSYREAIYLEELRNKKGKRY